MSTQAIYIGMKKNCEKVIQFEFMNGLAVIQFIAKQTALCETAREKRIGGCPKLKLQVQHSSLLQEY